MTVKSAEGTNSYELINLILIFAIGIVGLMNYFQGQQLGSIVDQTESSSKAVIGVLREELAQTREDLATTRKEFKEFQDKLKSAVVQ